MIFTRDPEGWSPTDFDPDTGEPTQLLQTLSINGVPHHLNALRVHERQTGWEFTIQEPVYDPNNEYDGLQLMYGGAYRTTDIPGFPGDWVLWLHPYSD